MFECDRCGGDEIDEVSVVDCVISPIRIMGKGADIVRLDPVMRGQLTVGYHCAECGGNIFDNENEAIVDPDILTEAILSDKYHVITD